ncbi:spindle pole body component 110-like [Pomacea canaliculata]|uniref:spindle pole body component 110-like n=1 Tax=Pomacea canaliculata TaxID=400727 RepID=UPI000D73A783|nr:spindle pole body component 110-like [Pomacea canaliculata]
MSNNNAGRPDRQHDELNNSEDQRSLSFGDVNDNGDRVPTLEAVKLKCAETNAEFQEQSRRLRQEVNEIREDQTQMRGQLENRIAQLQEQVNNKNHELQDAQAKICMLQHTKSENENSITAAKATVRSLEEEKVKWKKEKDEYGEQVKSFKQEADTLKLEIQNLKDTTLRQRDEIQENSKQRFTFVKEIQGM